MVDRYLVLHVEPHGLKGTELLVAKDARAAHRDLVRIVLVKPLEVLDVLNVGDVKRVLKKKDEAGLEGRKTIKI